MRATLNSKEVLICMAFGSFLLPTRPCLAQGAREPDSANHSDAIPGAPHLQTSSPFIFQADAASSTPIKSPLSSGAFIDAGNLPAAYRDHDAPHISQASAQAGFPYGPSRRQLTETIDPDKLGSTDVPMDSWIYPALERLADMGYIPTQSVLIRPWARKECLRQLREAENEVNRYNGNKSMDKQAELLISD